MSQQGEKGKFTSVFIEEFLSFEPTERPKWREATIDKDVASIPPISQMIKDIVEYKKRYNALKMTTEKEKRKGVLRDLLVKFLCSVQKEEDIGVKDKGKTERIMKDLDLEIEACGMKGHLSRSTDSIPHRRPHSSESSGMESHSSIESDIGDFHQRVGSSKHILKPSKSETETKNLYRAYRKIVEELRKSRYDTAIEYEDDTVHFTGSAEDCKGLIDVEALIIEIHEILMKDVMKKGQTPGKFSTNERFAQFQGTIHHYPWFRSETDAESAVQTLVDKVNSIIVDIKKVEPEEERFKLFFKCSSLFLFGFLSLHPFSDGNGRLARLLASYNLITFSPFMTPIYNVFSSSRECDCVQALVDARGNLKFPENSFVENAGKLAIDIIHEKPTDLCAMLVESNWTMWRQLLLELGDKNIRLFEWEIQNSEALKKTFDVKGSD